MHLFRHIKTILLITLLSLVFGSGVNAKLASGVQNLVVAPHQGETLFNPLMHQGKTDVSTIDMSGYTLGPKGTKLLPTPRESLLNSVIDPKLKRRIDALYRKNATVGNGSTADAIRYELKTGELLSPSGHSIKGIEMRNGLLKDIKSGRLNPTDTKIARGLLKDLQNALSGQ